MAANVTMAAAKNPAVQAAAKDAVRSAANVTMESLVARETAVATKMQDLRDRQQKVMALLESLQPNWPGHCLCIGPVVHHNIERQVPPDRAPFAKASYTAYFCTIFFLCYNAICAIAALASSPKEGKTDETNYGMHLGVSCIHLLGIPGAFMVWHFQVYKAVQTIGSLNRYGTAYLGIVIAFFYNVFMAIGLEAYGGCGWLFALKLKDVKESMAPFYMCLVNALFFTLQLIFFIYAFFKLRKYHRQDKAQSVAGVSLP